MYNVLVISDSHGLEREIKEIVERHRANSFIHCGDSELAANSAYLNNFTVVRGNCDWDDLFPEEQLIEMNGVNIYVTHGHLFQVKSTLQRLKNRALELNSHIVCF